MTESPTPAALSPGLVRFATRALWATLLLVAAGFLWTLVDPPGFLRTGTGRILLFTVPPLILLALGAALRGSDSVKVGAVMLVISSAVPLYASEIVVEWIGHQRTYRGQTPDDFYAACPGRYAMDDLCHAASEQGGEWDVRTRLAVVEAVSAEGETAWPNVYTPLFRKDAYLQVGGTDVLPLSGIANVPTVFCNESGTWHDYRSDERGYNNPSGVHGQEASIVLIGDSFTQGRCVDRSATFQGQIASRVPGTVSLGLDGAGPLHALGTLREFGGPLQPDVVLWMFFDGNDLTDLLREVEDPILHQYLEPEFSQGLIEIQEEIDQELMGHLMSLRADQESSDAERIVRRAWSHRLRHEMRLSSVVTLRRLRQMLAQVLRQDEGQPRLAEYPDDLMAQVIDAHEAEATRLGAQLVFVYLPSWENLSPDVEGFPFKNEVIGQIESRSIPIIDATVVLGQNETWADYFPYGLSAHYNEEGYGAVSDLIVRRLNSFGFLNPPSAAQSVIR